MALFDFTGLKTFLAHFSVLMLALPAAGLVDFVLGKGTSEGKVPKQIDF